MMEQTYVRIRPRPEKRSHFLRKAADLPDPGKIRRGAQQKMEGQSKENMELRGLKEEDVKDRNKWRHANPMKEQKKKKGDAQFILTAYTKYEATSWAGFDTTNSC